MSPSENAKLPCLLEQARRAAGRGGLQEAVDLLERATSSSGEELRLRGLIQLRLGRVEQAVADLERAAKRLQDCAACHLELGVALLRAGRLERAVTALRGCVARDPDNAQAHDAMAGALHRLGRRTEALGAASAAVELEPRHAGYLHNRAVVRTALGRHERAVQDYERVLELDPSSAGTCNNLAWLLATSPDGALRDGPRARALARQAVAAGSSAAWLDTLAAAQAECGDFAAAVHSEEQAYARSSPPNPRFRRRAELYRAGTTLVRARAAGEAV